VVHEREQPTSAADQFSRFRDHVWHRHLASQMQKVLDAKQVRAARGCNRLSEDLRLAVDVLRASSRQTRSESSTVVMPQVASWPS